MQKISMNKKFLFKTLAFSMLSTTIQAGALDRSGQSITPFLQDGNYFEGSISVLDAHVSGQIRSLYTPPNTSSETGEMAEDYQFYNAALKLQLNPHFSFGLIYDQPFGAAAGFPTQPNNTFSTPNGNTKADVDTQNLALMLGYQPNQNWNIYAGPVYQTIKGDVEINGRAYSVASGYKVSMEEDHAVGWLAGIAYQIPEIALKAAITYRSEIEHKIQAEETFSAPLSTFLPLVDTSQSTLTTPQSVNLDFQTGITPRTLLFANARWVNWSDFKVKPYQFGKITSLLTTNAYGYTEGLNLVDYSDDQWSLNLGLGQKLTDKWSGILYAGWDSGAGDPVSTLGPIQGYWAAGLGFQYNPTQQYFIAGGLKYFWLGDTTAQSATHSIPGNAENAKVADFEDNHALGYILKIGYKF